ncbi:MAG: hypothetical protein WDO68_26490 [Gammaproteobacteria bacterium]
MSNARRLRTLGILALADPHTAPPPPPNAFDSADWFPYATVVRMVPNAWARNVVAGKPELAVAYAETARELEALGVSAISADCGYAIQYQEAVRNAVSIPVACSSLLQLALIRNMLPRHGRIGLLCFDADTLKADYLRLAGIDDTVPLAIAGIQGTRSWKNWVAADTITEWNILEDDVMSAARKLHRQNPDITHWLLECTGFPRFRPLLKAETGLPVYDWVSLCNHLMEGAVPRPRPD